MAPLTARPISGESNLEREIEKQMGCMAGFLQLFDRPQIISAKRLYSPKRLTVTYPEKRIEIHGGFVDLDGVSNLFGICLLFVGCGIDVAVGAIGCIGGLIRQGGLAGSIPIVTCGDAGEDSDAAASPSL